MAQVGQEPVGSMGNDVPLAVLSDQNPLLFSYFRQLFAQVSNPPLDAIREELVTSLETFLGAERNVFDETPEHAHLLKLKEPFLTNREMAKLRELNRGSLRAKTLSTLFHVTGFVTNVTVNADATITVTAQGNLPEAVAEAPDAPPRSVKNPFA